jgi:type VI secretion system secreted protein VgrG
MADAFRQEHRRLRIDTPLGRDALLITALTGTEEISSLFQFQAELIGTDERADFDAIVGQGVTVSIAAGDGDRHVHGVVNRFAQSGTSGRHTTYRAEIVPWPWFLTRTTDCRIFQRKAVPDIVKQIFGEYGFSDYRFALSATYEPREYCVQYRETDWTFVARLLEEEGIFYFFEHQHGKHTLVAADGPRAHQPCPVLDHVRFIHEQVSLADDDVVTWFSKEQEVRASRCALADYNFETPSIDLSGSASGNDPRAYERYDYPACAPRRDRTEALARIRQQEEDATRVRFRGCGYARSFAPGFKFRLTGIRDEGAGAFDGSYILTSVRHRASESYAGGDESAVSYECDFECIEASVPFRPARRMPRPLVHGVQTALVVGPGGEEIFVDRYGRVKVQFFWDREGKRDENSSCWLRVSSSWAGKNWGVVSIPRIGQEVVVAFLEGDPDQPIIVGSVYNGEQMPPYELPGSKTQSGIKTRSTLGGSPANFNEIRFEDKKGSEQVYIHAEKNQDVEVENDKTEHVGHDETITIGNDRTETVGRNETLSVGADRIRSVARNETVTVALMRTHTVGVNEAITVGAAQEVTVGAFRNVAVGAAQTIEVGASQSVSVGANQSIAVGGNQSETIGDSYQLEVNKNRTSAIGETDVLTAGKKVLVEAGEEITLQTGQARLQMKKTGEIVIEGKTITVKASGDIVMKGQKILQN